MRHVIARRIGTALMATGLLLAVWCVLVWQWQDPFTALYTTWKQHELAQQYTKLTHTWKPPAQVAKPPKAAKPGAKPAAGPSKAAIALEAAAFRHQTHDGEAIGRIVIGRIGLNMVFVDGTDEETLKKGPGRYLGDFMPGENRLVYIAGHRTTYLAPFSHIDDIRNGDYIRLEMPYGTFVYRAVKHEIVPATDLAVLHSPKHELLRLQACHPRFFATHRYIVDAKLVSYERPAT